MGFGLRNRFDRPLGPPYKPRSREGEESFGFPFLRGFFWVGAFGSGLGRVLGQVKKEGMRGRRLCGQSSAHGAYVSRIWSKSLEMCGMKLLSSGAVRKRVFRDPVAGRLSEVNLRV
jgi:hypothetical protein